VAIDITNLTSCSRSKTSCSDDSNCPIVLFCIDQCIQANIISEQ
ncbi:unnamed protein product, partial [Allacma fusca]